MIIVIITYILNFFAPIVNTLGVFGVFGCIIEGDFEIFGIAGILAAIGFVFGLFAYGNGIPPKMFWTHSVDAIFSFSVTAVLGYALNFAMWPMSIYFIGLLL